MQKITSKNLSLESPAIYPNFFHAIMGAYVFVLLILLLWIFPQVFLGFTLVSMPILFFNAIFIFLIFPFNGPLPYKILLAGVGNVVGLVWEYFLGYLAANTCHYLGNVYGVLYFIVSPFLELLWIVSMWALGLSVLASKKESEKEVLPP